MPNATLEGVVVEQDPSIPLQSIPSPHDGLYLQTDDGRLIELITHSMPTQMPIEVMWRQSRKSFEAYLNQRITVQGYLSRRTLYSAVVVTPAAQDNSQAPID